MVKSKKSTKSLHPNMYVYILAGCNRIHTIHYQLQVGFRWLQHLQSAEYIISSWTHHKQYRWESVGYTVASMEEVAYRLQSAGYSIYTLQYKHVSAGYSNYSRDSFVYSFFCPE